MTKQRVSCGESYIMACRVISLSETCEWQFKERNLSISIIHDSTSNGWKAVNSMPSDVYAELRDSGDIPDPLIGFNEHKVQWVADKQWLYQTKFEGENLPEGRVQLVFEGLDTYCTVYLNGKEILKADNMFNPYTVDVEEQDLSGSNILVLHFDSARRIAKELEAKYGARRAGSCNLGDPSRVYVRKAQYHWRWDWGPELMSVGPWKPILLKTFRTCISDFHTRATLSGEDKLTPYLSVSVELEGALTEALTFELIVKGADDKQILQKVGRITALAGGVDRTVKVFDDSVPNAELWWPTGSGKQVLYNVEVFLYSEEGSETLDHQVKRVGFRSVELVRKPLDEADQYGRGTTFFFKINGVPTYMGGSNWIPADSMLTTIKPGRYRSWLQLLKDGNQNMVRVWGGGIYEPDVFYDTCDELGLLVWQDFLFACGVYPAHEEFVASVRREAEANVRRMRHHPCLVLWCGNNEDYQQVLQWGGIDKLPARVIYEEVLPDIVRQLSFDDVPYWPGSPYGGEGWDTSDPTIGDIHQWNIWAGKGVPWQNYDVMGGRFVSEFGIPSFPDIRTVNHWMQDGVDSASREALNSKYRYSNSAIMAQHNKAGSHEQRFGVLLNENFKATGDFESHVYLTQVLQSEAVSFAYRSWRREWKGPGKEYNGGTLVWQSNDCWPGTSWAIADYFLRPKPVYYTIARELMPVTQNRAHDRPRQFYEYGAIRSTECKIEVWGTNSTLREMLLHLELMYFDLVTLATQRESLEVKLLPNQSTEFPYIYKEMPTTPGGKPSEPSAVGITPSASVIVHARLRDPARKEILARYTDWPQPFRFLDLPDPGLNVWKSQVGEDEFLIVSVEKPAKCVVFSIREDGKFGRLGDGIRWEDNAFDLWPDEERKIGCKGLGKRHVWAAWMGNEAGKQVI